MANPKGKSIDRTAIFAWDDNNDIWVALGADASGSISVTESIVEDTLKVFEGTLTSGVSPLDLDLNAVLGRNATAVRIYNDGTGDFTYKTSTDGAAFGDAATIKKSDKYQGVEGVSIDTLRLTHSGTDADYRIHYI